MWVQPITLNEKTPGSHSQIHTAECKSSVLCKQLSGKMTFLMTHIFIPKIFLHLHILTISVKREIRSKTKVFGRLHDECWTTTPLESITACNCNFLSNQSCWFFFIYSYLPIFAHKGFSFCDITGLSWIICSFEIYPKILQYHLGWWTVRTMVTPTAHAFEGCFFCNPAIKVIILCFSFQHLLTRFSSN